MTIALETVLARAGLRVSAARFLSYVEDEAKRLSPPHPDPAAFFTPAQRAALTDVGLDLDASDEHEVDGRARSVAAQAVLRDSALSVADAAARLGIDGSRVRHQLAANQLAGWKERGEWRLPAWQFAGDAVLPGLRAVLAELPDDQPPLVIAAFMSTPQRELIIHDEPVSPRSWLLAGGDPARVAVLMSVLGTPA